MADTLSLKIEVEDNGSAVIKDFQGNVQNFGQDVEDTSAQTGDAFNGIADEVEDSSARSQSSIGDLGGAFSAFGVDVQMLSSVGIAGALVGAVTASILSFAQWEQSLFSIQDATGMSATEAATLGDALRAMSTDALYGAQSADTLAAVAAEGAGALRLAADTDILAFTQAVGEIASTTKLSTQEATTVMIDLEKTFKQSLEATGQTAAEQSRNIASAINVVASDETFGPIAELTNKIGAAGQAFGLSAADVIGFSATLINAGVDTGRGAQAIRDLFTGLTTDSRSFADAFQIDAQRLATAMKTDPKQALDLVITSMGQLATTQGPAALAQRLQDLGMGGGASADVLTRLSTVTTELDANMQRANQGFQQGGAFQAELAGQADTLSGKFTQMKTAVAEMGLSFGQDLGPAAHTVMSGVISATDLLAQGVHTTTQGIQNLGTNVGTLIGDLSTGQTSLRDMVGAIPGMFVVTGEQLAAASGKLMDFGDKLKSSGSEIQSFFGAGIQAITQGVGNLGTSVGTLIGDLTTAQTSLGELVGAIPGMFTGIAEQIGVTENAVLRFQQRINLLGQEKLPEWPDNFSPDAQASLDVLAQFYQQNKDIIDQSPEFSAQYKQVFRDVRDGVQNSIPVSAELIQQMEGLRQAVYEVGDEATGHSTFPDLIAAEEQAKAKTAELTGQMESQRAKVTELGAAYEPIAAKVQAQENAVKAVTAQIQRLRDEAVNASAYQQIQIGKEIELLNNERQKRQEVLTGIKQQAQEAGKPYQNAQRELEKLEREVDRAASNEEKAVQRVDDARQKAADWLAQNQEKSAAAMQKHLDEEAQKNQDIQNQRRQAAQESLQFITQLSAGARQRLMAEEDIIAALEAQGITLDPLQQEQLLILQREEQREAAIQAQTAALEQQLTAAQSLGDAFAGIGDNLGNLSSGIQGIGDIFNVDTSRFTGALGRIQEFAQLPQMISGIGSSISGLFGNLGGLGQSLGGLFGGGAGGLGGILGSLSGGISGLAGSIGGALSGALGGIGSALGGILPSLSGLLPALGPIGLAGGAIALAWGPLKDLFKDVFGEAKSQGREAADALQAFVAQNIAGGDQLSQAMRQSYADMGAAGNDFATFLQQTGTTMDATFGGISANWQQGSTALDLFTQSLVAAGVQEDKAPQQALQMMAAFQDMGLSAEEAGAKMLEIAEASGMSEEQVNALRDALGGVTEQMAGTGEEGGLTTEIFDEATTKTQDLTGKVDTLSGALDDVTGQMSGTGDETGDTTKMFRDASTASQGLSGKIQALDGDVARVGQKMSGAAGETANTSGMFNQAGGASDALAGKIGALDSAVLNVAGKMSGAADETANTSGMFNTAGGASDALTGKIGELDSAVRDVAGKMSGAAGETANTSGMFNQAGGASDALTGKIGELDSAVLDVAGKMSGAAGETANTSGMFNQAGGASDALSNDMDALSGQLGEASNDTAALRQALAELPNEKNIDININTNGEIPEMARGGRIGAMGLAIYNEAGFEAARLPGGSLALLTTPGPALGAFPVGTEIIPAYRTQQLLRQYPNLPRMATGGTIDGMQAVSIGQITINNYFQEAPSAANIDRLTDQMSRTLAERIRRML